MDHAVNYRRMGGRSLFAVAIGAVLVTVCYFFVDRPVAYFVHDHDLKRFEVLRWLTYPEPFVQFWTPLAFVGLAARRAWGPLRGHEMVLLAACVALLVGDQCRETLQIPFSRLWPETWINNNPSLIHNGAYGFHPFHGGAGYASFPSGHMARALAVAAVVWTAYPKCRWVCVLVPLILAGGLLGMNYHFVGDLIGGAFVGSLVGAYTAACCGLTNLARQETAAADSQPRASGRF